MLPPVASRFVAGESIPAALEHTRELNDSGVGAILNHLGEHYHDPAPAAEDRTEYLALLDELGRLDDRACISVKPSQLGLGVGEELFRENYRDVVARAAEQDAFVWCDMEDHDTTDATLDAFEDTAREFGDCVGLCLQANLRRTADDLRRLADVPGKVRLVKGAYDPPKDVAFQGRAQVNEAYRDLIEQAFRTRDGGIAIGSHDPAMIDHATTLHEEYGTDFEIQMLMGVRTDAQFDLADEYDVWQYVPYGDRWLSYFYRRVMERKENLTFAVRALVSG